MYVQVGDVAEGLVSQVKDPRTFLFRSLSESIVNPVGSMASTTNAVDGLNRFVSASGDAGPVHGLTSHGHEQVVGLRSSHPWRDWRSSASNLCTMENFLSFTQKKMRHSQFLNLCCLFISELNMVI